MFCFVAKWMLSKALDNRREPPARVLSHIEQCDSCRRYHEEVVVLQGHLEHGEWPGSEYPEFLHARIMNAVKSDRHRLKVWKSVRPLAAGAVVALIVFGISAAWFAGSEPSRRNTAVTVNAEWGSLQHLESGLEQAEALLNQGPDLFVRPLSDEMQLLESDISKVALRLASILDRDILNMIADQS